MYRAPQTLIGQAWHGRHVVLLHCTEKNVFSALYKSYHAPIEPARENCAETLSQLISIGYRIYSITALPSNKIQYTLVL
jgi:RecB family exonuclease